MAVVLSHFRWMTVYLFIYFRFDHRQGLEIDNEITRIVRSVSQSFITSQICIVSNYFVANLIENSFLRKVWITSMIFWQIIGSYLVFLKCAASEHINRSELLGVLFFTQLFCIVIFFIALRYQKLALLFKEFKDHENIRYKKLVDSSREAMILYNFGKPDFLND